jgi:glutamate dehydrogenase
VDAEDVARVHFTLGERLGLPTLVQRILALPREDRWQAMARAALRDDLYAIHRELTAEVLRSGPRLEGPDERVSGWIEAHRDSGRCLQTLADIAAGRTFDITTLSVAVREVRELLEAARQDKP